MSVAVLGAGAFGTALAIAQAQTGDVALWARDSAQAQDIMQHRENRARLPDAPLPEAVAVTTEMATAVRAETLLLAVPMQNLRAFLQDHGEVLAGKTLVACCKGMELETGLGPLDIIDAACPGCPRALLTGPSFARDIARGLPTALTLACADEARGTALQHILSTQTLRLYRTTDEVGATLGGALKNVMAIACGAAMGAGLGESARAALMTRGNAEMQRLARHKGAEPITLSGLSGFGDLVLTCTSELSRNYRFGLSIGSGTAFDPSLTVEGAATARAVASTAKAAHIEMPIATTVAALVEKRLDVQTAMTALLSRSLKEE